MASLAGVFAASHMPPMVNAPDAAGPEVRREAFAAYETLGRRLRACAPDVLVIVGPDHFQNFFVDNLPGFPDNVTYDRERELFWVAASRLAGWAFASFWRAGRPSSSQRKASLMVFSPGMA